jgi:DNA helicase-2/ATP-dependent DNA helicase PcrA
MTLRRYVQNISNMYNMEHNRRGANMRFFSDFHIHSRYSRATSSSLALAELGRAAVRKGIAVIGTGDFTHPSWMKEMDEVLEEAEPGLYRLKDRTIETRFILTSEISTIYKQGDKVRKVHHLLGAPDRETAKKIAASLARVGNILSDGRPILGITSRNLLEIVMEGSENAFLIPAHIWTPWFSVLGSKSGFDSIAECYLDLEPHIFAVETGLSSDPPMNWRVKSLDRYHLVSNSDAHSADKLGREATIFDTTLDYHALRRAMATGEGLLGTVEFFPEEGKYHLDGHRDCNVVLSPEETRELGGICPVCKRPLTVGVLSRVEDLADRPEGEKPGSARPFYSLIPLTEILGEIMQVGSTSRKVSAAYERLIARLGGELPLLADVDTDEIRAVAGETLALAVSRMRAGEVHREGGYDGKFGRVRVFRDNEQDMLFDKGLFGMAPKPKKTPVPGRTRKRNDPKAGGEIKLDSAQEEAVCHWYGPLMVVAGPGTGKTRVLVERIKSLVKKGETSILAVTFTQKAAQEIRERLAGNQSDTPPPLSSPFVNNYVSLPWERGEGEGATAPAAPCDDSVPADEEGLQIRNPQAASPESSHCEVTTFHGLAAGIMRDAGIAFDVADEGMLLEMAEDYEVLQIRNPQSATPESSLSSEGEGKGEGGRPMKKWVDDLLYRQSTCAGLDAEQTALIDRLKDQGCYTYEGLIMEACRLLASGACTKKWDHVMVDEFQDINPLQQRFLKAINSGAKSVMVIGDPSQAIYGFRGSSPRAFDDFLADHPVCAKTALRRTFRLTRQLAGASNSFIGRDAVEAPREGPAVRIVRAEAPYEFLAREIESLAGGMSHRGVGKAGAEYALSDIAVIVRTQNQASPVMESLGKASIPFDTAYARPLADVRGIRERIALLEGRGWEGYVKGVGEAALERIASHGDPGDAARRKISEAKDFLAGLDGPIPERIARIEDRGLFKLPMLESGHAFYQYAQLYGTDVSRFVEFLKLSNDQGTLGIEKVHVITAHAAKGLEFRCVFMTGLARGVFPLEGLPPAEEQNLFYVAMTRASDFLYLLCPPAGESEFVPLIPAQYADLITAAPAKPKSSQMKLFD